MTRATLLIALMAVDERACSLRAAAMELRDVSTDAWSDSAHVSWAARCEAEAWRCSVARDDIAGYLAGHPDVLERTA